MSELLAWFAVAVSAMIGVHGLMAPVEIKT